MRVTWMFPVTKRLILHRSQRADRDGQHRWESRKAVSCVSTSDILVKPLVEGAEELRGEIAAGSSTGCGVVIPDLRSAAFPL